MSKQFCLCDPDSDVITNTNCPIHGQANSRQELPHAPPTHKPKTAEELSDLEYEYALDLIRAENAKLRTALLAIKSASSPDWEVHRIAKEALEEGE